MGTTSTSVQSARPTSTTLAAEEGDRAVSSLYFDHAASAPRRAEVQEAMAPFSFGVVGNPSGSHRAARAARTALDDAREEVAELTGSMPGGVVFTGGGTESCNLAIFGVTADRTRRGSTARVIASSIEHQAILSAGERLADGMLSAPVELSLLGVTRDGVVDLDAVVELLGGGADIVSVMTANNETGVIQPIRQLAELVHEQAPTTVVHTDAVAAAPWLDLVDAAAGADLVTIGAHKLGGPVGIGALCFRREIPLAPLFVGGGQERGRRAGTPDVAAAVGLAVALRLSVAEQRRASAGVVLLRDRLAALLETGLPGVHLTAPGAPRLPGTCHVLIEGVASHEVVEECDREGLCVSAGVSFASGSSAPSHVLTAMGVDGDLARGSLRLSFGAETTPAEVDRAARIVLDVVSRLRGDARG